MKETVLSESELASFAKKCREEAGKTRTEAARELEVSVPTLFQAEEQPQQSLHKLRVRIIERFSNCEVKGPVYIVRKKEADH